MTTRYVKAAISSNGEENSPLCFGEWLKRRRQELDLTQDQLAKRASCSVFAIRKIELGERRPSKQLAGLLAQSLETPVEDQANFIKAARGELSMERFTSPVHIPPRDLQPAVNCSAIPENLPRANLPRALTPFIGRESEISALGRLVCDPQCLLLTIVGPGGIGKTRLALEVAHQFRDHFTDGVWFVPLVAVSSPALIIQAIADAVHFRFQDPTNPQAHLLRYLCDKKALLLLDNAEHLLEGVGLFTEILLACPQVKLLVTSRERLNLLSEWVFEIMGLPVPPNVRVEQFEAYSSVALFLQSARRVQVGFKLREEDRRWVLKICQMMEGMPLGVELSAAWVGVLPCEAIANEIERNIDFLTVSMRDLPERQRSLRATLDYSWRLLNPEEKLMLSRLSVFLGRFRREAAESICGARLGVLSSLRSKMLLYRRDEDFYYLHENVRQYAELKLREDPIEDNGVKDRHASYYVGYLAEWEKALKSSRQVETFNEMAQVVGNLSRAWLRMVTSFQPQTLQNGQFSPDLFHRSLFSLSLFYEMFNRSLEAIPLFKESVAYLKSIQNAFIKTEDRCILYSVQGHATAYLGLHHFYLLQYEQSLAYLEEAIQLLEKGQSRIIRAQVQVMLASTYNVQGQLQKASVLLEQSREVFREDGEGWWYVLSTSHLASVYLSLGKQLESEVLFQEGFNLIEPGDLRTGLPHRIHYAYLLNLKKDFARAEQLLQDGLQLSHQLGDLGQTASILFELGRLAYSTHQIELAEEYLHKSLNILNEFGKIIDPSSHLTYLGLCLVARHHLHAARDQFRQVTKIGQTVTKPHVVYRGLVSIARTYLEEGQTEKALEMALALRHYPVEFIRFKEECDRLLADLQARLPQGQVEAAIEQVGGKFTPDPAGAKALAYAMELDTE